jgi:hypothetical protein
VLDTVDRWIDRIGGLETRTQTEAELMEHIRTIPWRKGPRRGSISDSGTLRPWAWTPGLGYGAEPDWSHLVGLSGYSPEPPHIRAGGAGRQP